MIIIAAAARDLSGEVAQHVRGAPNRGATREELIEVILQCSPCISFPKTNHALKAAKEIFDQRGENEDHWKARQSKFKRHEHCRR